MCSEMNDNEIIQAITSEDTEDDEDEETNFQKENVGKISHAEAKATLELVALFIKQQEKFVIVDLMFRKSGLKDKSKENI